jgi:hypothetical protein
VLYPSVRPTSTKSHFVYIPLSSIQGSTYKIPISVIKKWFIYEAMFTHKWCHEEVQISLWKDEKNLFYDFSKAYVTDEYLFIPNDKKFDKEIVLVRAYEPRAKA